MKLGSKRIKGVAIDWFWEKKYGWIKRADGKGNIYVHRSDVVAIGQKILLWPHENVEFHVMVQKDGKNRAVNVTGPDGGYTRCSIEWMKYMELLECMDSWYSFDSSYEDDSEYDSWSS